MSVSLKNSAVATELEKISFHSNPKEGQCQRMYKLPYTSAQFTCQQGNTQNLQTRLQQYMSWELLELQTGFRKGRGTRNQIANICWIIERAREFQKDIDFYLIDYAKTFCCVDHNKLWKICQDMDVLDHLTCLLRNLYEGQEATVRTGHGKMNWFKIWKRIHPGIYCQTLI